MRLLLRGLTLDESHMRSIWSWYATHFMKTPFDRLFESFLFSRSSLEEHIVIHNLWSGCQRLLVTSKWNAKIRKIASLIKNLVRGSSSSISFEHLVRASHSNISFEYLEYLAWASSSNISFEHLVQVSRIQTLNLKDRNQWQEVHRGGDRCYRQRISERRLCMKSSRVEQSWT